MKPLHFIMHIPKTAGMSLQALVRRRYSPKELQLVYTQAGVENGFEDHENLKVVMGHYRFGYHRFSKRPYSYSVILRNPIDQVISHYNYTLDHPEKFEYLPKNIHSIIDFVLCPYGNNLQCRFVSGIDIADEKSLQVAKENLIRHFAVVGLAEDFDRSILMLGKHLNWRIKFYTNENRGKARKKFPAPTPEELQQLQEILKFDIALYEFGKMLFYNQLNKHPDINFRLKLFLPLNKWFQKLNPAYTKIKLWLKFKSLK